MAELGDSSEMKPPDRSPPTSASRVPSSAPSVTSVDLWEIGNEVNGEWVGSTSKEMAKVTSAYNSVKAVGGKTELTLDYNPHCFTKRSHEMFSWAESDIPPSMKSGLDVVLISYYPGDCGGYWPTPAGWQSVFDRLHAVFPDARLGFGNRASARTRDRRRPKPLSCRSTTTSTSPATTMWAATSGGTSPKTPSPTREIPSGMP